MLLRSQCVRFGAFSWIIFRSKTFCLTTRDTNLYNRSLQNLQMTCALNTGRCCFGKSSGVARMPPKQLANPRALVKLVAVNRPMGVANHGCTQQKAKPVPIKSVLGAFNTRPTANGEYTLLCQFLARKWANCASQSTSVRAPVGAYQVFTDSYVFGRCRRSSAGGAAPLVTSTMRKITRSCYQNSFKRERVNCHFKCGSALFLWIILKGKDL